MRTISAILESAEEIAPILGFVWPIGVLEDFSRKPSSAPQRTTDIVERLDALDAKVENLISQIYSRVPSETFNDEVLRTSDHVARLWQHITNPAKHSLLSVMEILWANERGSLPKRQSNFALSLCALGGLDDFRSWVVEYWRGNADLVDVVYAQRSRVKSMLSSGVIDLVKDLSEVSNAAFAIACYHCILGRMPDNEGLDGFLKHLENGGSRRDVFDMIYFSNEADARFKSGLTLPSLRNDTRDGNHSYLVALGFVLNASCG